MRHARPCTALPPALPPARRHGLAIVAALLFLAGGAPAGEAPAQGEVVSLPADFDWAPPLHVLRTGPGAFTVDKTAEELGVELAAGQPLVRTYVDPEHGSDHADGASSEHALQSLQAAANRTVAGINEVVVIAPPSRVVWGAQATAVGFACSAYIHPSDAGEVVFCKAPRPTWVAAAGGTYTTAGPVGEGNTSLVMDWSPQARAAAPDGGGLGYERLADAAAVAGHPGGFFHDPASGVVTVCPFDGRNLVGDAWLTPPAAADQNCWSLQTPSAASEGRFYRARGCHWVGGLNPLGMNNNAASNVRSRYLFERCGWWAGATKGNAMASVGPNDIYTFDCIGGYSGADLWNLHGNGHGSGHVLHVRPRCTVRNGFGGTGRDNVDTGHEDSRGITVMPHYAHSDGRVHGWIDRSRSLVFGGTIGPSLRSDGFSASVNSGGRSVVDLFEVTLVASPGPATLTADGTTSGSGAAIRCHGMDVTRITTRGANIAGVP